MHQHLWPRSFVDVLRRRTSPPRLDGDVLATTEGSFPIDLALHDPERRLAALDRDRIDTAVVTLQSTLGVESLARAERDELELAWLEGIHELVRDGGGRYLALAPWRVDPATAGTSVGASALLTEHGAGVLARVDEVGGLLFVHPEAEGPLPPGRPEWWQWTAGYAGQMQRAYLAWLGGLRDDYPKLTIVFAMLAGGAPIQHERLIHRGVNVRESPDPGTVFETSSYGRRAIELCIETFGVERLAYGSDTPVIDPAPTLGAIHSLGDSVARLLQSDTPERLIGQQPRSRRSAEP